VPVRAVNNKGDPDGEYLTIYAPCADAAGSVYPEFITLELYVMSETLEVPVLV